MRFRTQGNRNLREYDQTFAYSARRKVVQRLFGANVFNNLDRGLSSYFSPNLGTPRALIYAFVVRLNKDP